MRRGLIAVLLLWAPGIGAQALVDPTRPPNAVSSTESAPAPTQVQSILVSQGRKVAVINGETVTVGSQLGDATVVRITATEVTLRRGAEQETLGMYAGIDKKPVRARARPAAPVATGSAVEKGKAK